MATKSTVISIDNITPNPGGGAGSDLQIVLTAIHWDIAGAYSQMSQITMNALSTDTTAALLTKITTAVVADALAFGKTVARTDVLCLSFVKGS